jgi:hypothetical protein
MNAVTATKEMAQKLIDANFDVTIEETATSFNFSAMSRNEWYSTTHIFTAGAYVTGANRTRKYFSATRSMAFAKTVSKRNISYVQMNREIDYAIRLQKVGA